MTTAATRPTGLVLALLLAGCAPATAPEAPVEAPATTPEGDVLVPDVYSFAGEAAWDGRPSLGGVWVAHPEVEEPIRVRISREGDDGAAVTGALFRRQRAGEGPAMQVSSDAALALGLAAGEPATLSVVALRSPPEPQDAVEAAPPDHEQDP